jgi:aryl-alcohol dehydrogenase-like predicted oxidoreductase
MFGELAYDLNRAIPYTPFEDQLEAISTALEKGQIRGWGISNETAWGLTKWCAASQLLGVQRPEVLQNAFHLLCRTAESGLFEACHEEQVAFQAYSPLAMGLLTGKYSKAELRWKVGREQGDVTGWSGPKDGRLCQYRQRYAEAESRYGLLPFENQISNRQFAWDS